ncbi:hypothetical protein BKA64DRAFT_704704 [Cadophora sp. MPI-SDFR-AT-0126]|nr:hypothetical protein BKA64DRAFT_704704 [Leotiomycetes sp. MPI-SDFR-AT-0126]
MDNFVDYVVGGYFFPTSPARFPKANLDLAAAPKLHALTRSRDWFMMWQYERLRREYEEAVLADSYRPRTEQEAAASDGGNMSSPTFVGSAPRRPYFSSTQHYDYNLSFHIPIEAYGPDDASNGGRNLDIIRRFLLLPTDHHDGTGNLLDYLQRTVAEINNDMQHHLVDVDERWTKAGLSAAIWREVRTPVVVENTLRFHADESTLREMSRGPPINNSTALRLWLGWVSRVYENEIDLRRADIPVDPPRYWSPLSSNLTDINTMGIQREKAVLEFMQVNPTWENFAPWVAVLNEFEFYMLKWYLRNDLHSPEPKNLTEHENPLARRLAEVEFGDLDSEYGHLIEKFSQEDKPRERRMKDKSLDNRKGKEKVMEAQPQHSEADEVDDSERVTDKSQASTFAPKAKSKIPVSGAARRERSDWGQERTKMTEDEIRMVQPDYDTIGRLSHGKMARHKAFRPGGEGDRKGVGMVELTDTEFRNLVRHRIANKIHIPKLRPRDNEDEQQSWDEAARKRSQKLEDALDAARKKAGVSKAERQRLLEDWEGPMEYPKGERLDRLKTIIALGADALAKRAAKS